MPYLRACVFSWDLQKTIHQTNSPSDSQLHAINFDVSFLNLKSMKNGIQLNIRQQSTLKSKKPLSWNGDISANCASNVAQKTSLYSLFLVCFECLAKISVSGFYIKRKPSFCKTPFFVLSLSLKNAIRNSGM